MCLSQFPVYMFHLVYILNFKQARRFGTVTDSKLFWVLVRSSARQKSKIGANVEQFSTRNGFPLHKAIHNRLSWSSAAERKAKNQDTIQTPWQAAVTMYGGNCYHKRGKINGWSNYYLDSSHKKSKAIATSTRERVSAIRRFFRAWRQYWGAGYDRTWVGRKLERAGDKRHEGSGRWDINGRENR